MQDIKDHINRVSTKLQHLLKEYKQLQKENESLTKTIADLNIKQKQQATAIEDLEQKISILKASVGNMSDADKKDFEKRIGGFVKQLDKTIHLLSEEG